MSQHKNTCRSNRPGLIVLSSNWGRRGRSGRWGTIQERIDQQVLAGGVSWIVIWLGSDKNRHLANSIVVLHSVVFYVDANYYISVEHWRKSNNTKYEQTVVSCLCSMLHALDRIFLWHMIRHRNTSMQPNRSPLVRAMTCCLDDTKP